MLEVDDLCIKAGAAHPLFIDREDLGFRERTLDVSTTGNTTSSYLQGLSGCEIDSYYPLMWRSSVLRKVAKGTLLFDESNRSPQQRCQQLEIYGSDSGTSCPWQNVKG